MTTAQLLATQKVRYRLVWNHARRLNKRGEGLVEIEMQQGRRRRYISTHTYLPPENWSQGQVVGTPDDNADGYTENRLVDKAGLLRGRLLLVHDDQDATVVPQHTVQFLKNAVGNGTHPDLMVYPGHEHNVRGVDRVHLYEHITRYFEEHLK